jgi:hypothetical protein
MILTEVFLFFLSQKHWLVDEKVSDQENIDLVTPFSEERVIDIISNGEK